MFRIAEFSLGLVGTVTEPPLVQIDLNGLLQYGGKETAIVLAIAAVILAIAQLLKVLLPVLGQRQ